MRLLFIAFLIFAADLKSEFESLVQAERAFSDLSLKSGVRDAFLANLADDGIVFRPTAVNGKQWFQNNPAPAGQLTWQPEFADISNSADLGYTTGPFRYQRVNNGEQVVAAGYYVTIWKKQSSGQWKVALDTGINCDAQQRRPLPEVLNFTISVVDDVEKPKSAKDIRSALEALTAVERKFPTTSRDYTKVFAVDARLYRDDNLPYTFPDQIRKALEDRAGTFVWKLGDVGISNSVDLGYAYGVVEFKPADASKPSKTYNYLRIWKREARSDWKVVLDLLSA